MGMAALASTAHDGNMPTGTAPAHASNFPRILHVVRNLDVGGLEVGVVNLIDQLHRRGFVQGVCCLLDRGELAGRLPDAVRVWVCGAPGTRRPWHRLPLRATRCLREFRPDVVHVRNCSAWADATLAWLLAGRPGRLAFSFHGWDRSERMPRWRAFQYRQLARWTPSLAAVSREAADAFARETGIPAARFRALCSGVNVEHFRPRENDTPGNGPIVLGCVARLIALKNHALLVRVLGRLVREQGLNVELRLLGDGPERPALEKLTLECGMGERVQFLGAVADVPERLRELDIFVLASQREGRPTSIMEAMASGLPIVATAVGSMPALVEVGREGFLVPPADEHGFCQAVARLVCDVALRSRLARAARARAVREMSLGRMVEDYTAFYQTPVRSHEVNGK